MTAPHTGPTPEATDAEPITDEQLAAKAAETIFPRFQMSPLAQEVMDANRERATGLIREAIRAAVRDLKAEVGRLEVVRANWIAACGDATRRARAAEDRAARLEAERAEWVKEREGLRQIAVSAKDYLDCLAEFTDTAAGNLSDCCQEYLQHLDGAVDVWRVAAARDAQEGQGG